MCTSKFKSIFFYKTCASYAGIHGDSFKNSKEYLVKGTSTNLEKF